MMSVPEDASGSSGKLLLPLTQGEISFVSSVDNSSQLKSLFPVQSLAKSASAFNIVEISGQPQCQEACANIRLIMANRLVVGSYGTRNIL
jgi:hypothetical protein